MKKVKENKTKVKTLSERKRLESNLNVKDKNKDPVKNTDLMTSNLAYANFTPLNTPKHLRNNSSKTNNDIYGINPLPSIRSPYASARESQNPLTNLESWGVSQRQHYDDPFSMHRLFSSPFMPVYSSITKKKVIF